MRVILASASPRRLELLRQIGLDVQVVPSAFDEQDGEAAAAHAVVLANAVGKCGDVVKRCGDAVPVIAADTVVVIDDDILGKPQNEEAAAQMLQRLSERAHEVLTGVCIRYRGQELSAVCATKVFFRKLEQQEIAAYIATGEPLDKAGAYGIQGRGAVLVEKIDGDYSNVVGLPLTRVYEMLKALGADFTG